MKMKGFKPWFDSIQHIQTRRKDLQNKNFLATDRYLTSSPDSGQKLTPQQESEYKSAKKETESLSLQISKLDDQISILTSKQLNPYYDSIARTAVRISQQMHMVAVFEVGENRPMTCPSDKMLMVDITNDVALALGVKPNLLRVGIYNSDSLMRLMPGYAAIADSTKRETDQLNVVLENMDQEIEKLQHELDSLRPGLSKRNINARESQIEEKKEARDITRAVELYRIDEQDSVRTATYRKKFRLAVAAAAKAQNCQKYNDAAVAREYWTSKEAEFIDLNPEIAKLLKP